MSVVTNVILTFAVGEKRENVLEQLKMFKYNGVDPFIIASIDDVSLPRAWYGGSKFMECNICLGAYNHLDIDGLVTFLRGLQWDDPEAVQLIIREQFDSRFRIIDLLGG